jgi:predicted nucleic acid-binding protein
LSYLIDTNILSELRKRGRCDPHVAAWYRSARREELFLSVLVIGELRRGAERVRHSDARQFTALEKWLILAVDRFADRIIPIDRMVAEEWGRIGADAQVPVVDALLAATAKVRRLTMVTRNVRDFSAAGVQLLNPFEPRS